MIFALEEFFEALFGEVVVVGAIFEAFFELEDVAGAQVAHGMKLVVSEGLSVSF